MIETPRELAVRLLREHGHEIGVAVHKLVVKLDPKWAGVEREAFAGNAGSLLSAIDTYLSGGDVEIIFRFARDAMRIRKLSGFTGTDFNVLMHTYLPVLRKAFMARAPTPRQGLAAYEAAESVMLPIVTRLVEAIARIDEITTPDAQPPFHGRPFEAVSVNEQLPEFMLPEYEDDDDDEPTDPGRR